MKCSLALRAQGSDIPSEMFQGFMIALQYPAAKWQMGFWTNQYTNRAWCQIIDLNWKNEQ